MPEFKPPFDPAEVHAALAVLGTDDLKAKMTDDEQRALRTLVLGFSGLMHAINVMAGGA